MAIILPRNAMAYDGTWCGTMSVRPSVRHYKPEFYQNG